MDDVVARTVAGEVVEYAQAEAKGRPIRLRPLEVKNSSLGPTGTTSTPGTSATSPSGQCRSVR